MDSKSQKNKFWFKLLKFGSFPLIKSLLQNGMSINKLINNNENLVETVVNRDNNRNDNESIVKLFLDYGFNFNNVNLGTVDVKKCFLWICENGNTIVLTNLVGSYKEAINKIKLSTDKNGNNGLHLAVLNQHTSVVDYLLHHVYFGDCDNDSGNHSGDDCDYDYDETKDNTLFGSGMVAINQTNRFGATPAITASKDKNSLDIFKLLLQYGCQLTAVMSDEVFPLYIASYYDNREILKYIIDCKLSLSETINTSGDKKYHSTPLMAAIAMNNTAAVRTLCSCDIADIDNVKSKFGNNFTALEYGAYFGNGRILKILLRTYFKRNNIKDWKSIETNGIDRKLRHLKTIARNGINAIKKNKDWYSNSESCVILLEELLKKGIYVKDYNYIFLCLRHNVTNAINVTHSSLSNQTIMIEYADTYIKYLSNDDDEKKLESKLEVSIGGNRQRAARWYVGEMLGHGTFGNVFEGTDIYNNKTVALKFISINKLSQNSESKKKQITSFIMNELESVELIDHCNVIKLLAYNLNVDNLNTMLLVFECAIFGELYKFLSSNKYFNHEITKTYFKQILDALEACHILGIIHRDLKLQNILLDSKYQIKIADFGLSTYDNDIENKNQLFVGTRGYMSPEIASPDVYVDYDENDNIIAREITPLCDIFSLGVILWQLLNGINSMPFDEATESDLKYFYIAQREFKLFWKCHRGSRIVDRSLNDANYNNVQRLLLKMFEFNPDKRITIKEIRNCQWYQNIQGYTGDSVSKTFFQETMQAIHQRVKMKEKNNKQNMKSIFNYTQSTFMSNSKSAINKSTAFEFKTLRYALFNLCILVFCYCNCNCVLNNYMRNAELYITLLCICIVQAFSPKLQRI